MPIFGQGIVMQTPDPSEIAKLPRHEDRGQGYPFAAPRIPVSVKCRVDGHACYNHYCRMPGGKCILMLTKMPEVRKHDEPVNRDLIQVVTGVIAIAVLAMFVGWWLLL